jgi:hypothetical protein
VSLLTGTMSLRTKLGGRPSAECQAEMMHNVVQPRCSSRPRRKHVRVKALREYAPTAQDSSAVESASKNHNANWATGDRQISQMPAITAVDLPRLRAATRTGAYHGHGAHHGQSASFIAGRVVHDKATRHQTGGLECGGCTALIPSMDNIR